VVVELNQHFSSSHDHMLTPMVDGGRPEPIDLG
jgi:hypothetical protein